MKTIGLIGGITPQSTVMYYEVLNRLASSYYGGVHSSKVLINSLDFGEVSELQEKGHWNILDKMMSNAAFSLEKAGAHCILICANTMHLSIHAIQAVVNVPVFHIAEATAIQIKSQKLSTVALLGTKYTMEKTFFKEVLSTFGISTMIPDKLDRQIIHNVIYSELSRGELHNNSKQAYLSIIEKLVAAGAKGIILGCTEIPLLIKQDDVAVPVFDTTTIHAQKAFDFAID